MTGTTVLIGLDDTDNETSIGTGRLARMLASECEDRGMRVVGVTRHQFLVDSRIPYTSHNSGACIGVQTDEGLDAFGFAFDFVAERSADGSDPGVCVEFAEAVPAEVMKFGQRATSEVLQLADAYQLARRVGIDVRGLGGDDLGVIGAMGSVGLRAEGNDGRFIDLPGIRDMGERVTAGDFTELGIGLEHCTSDRSVDVGDFYDTLDWVRPRNVAGRAILFVEWSEERNAWIPVDRKKDKRSA